MHVITGLGNPGRAYKNTRHNVGFEVISALARRNGILLIKRKFRAKCGAGRVKNAQALLVMPQTYMNLSGYSVAAALSFYNAGAGSLIVICDDTALPLGAVRIRKKGGAGGHNGLKNIISEVGTDEFIRVRIGIGQKPERMDLADYVLGKFSKSDKVLIENGILRAASAVEAILSNGIDYAMNAFNAAL